MGSDDLVEEPNVRCRAAATTPASAAAHRLHDVRHLHATLLLLEGVPVHVVANRLGHSDPAVTLLVYAHVLRESATGVAEVFAGAIERAAVSKSVSKLAREDDETRRSGL